MRRKPGPPPGIRLDGDEVHRLRVEVCRLTAAELADRIGRSPFTVWKAERGQPVSEVVVSRLAHEFGVQMRDITAPQPEAPAA